MTWSSPPDSPSPSAPRADRHAMAGQPTPPPEAVTRAAPRLQDVVWPEITGRPLVLVPVGSTEQHGPHLPLNTDTAVGAPPPAAGAPPPPPRGGVTPGAAPPRGGGSR
ncbi:creatininase family protein, partial [Streptomyces sp. NPDC059766]|uniref:creatininase family protein n=1 Tax=Streptomyces sp. NPDC059766 TaxID=3346940 RepID=UPI00364EE9FF